MSEFYQQHELNIAAAEAGLLLGVESFLRGLPDNVRNSLTAGDLADTILRMIDNVRSKRREQQ